MQRAGGNGVGDVKKPSLAALDLPDVRALPPAARQWLETVAHVRLHGATRQTPSDLWQPEKAALPPLPLQPFASATVSQVRASRQFRMPVDTNRSSVPAALAGHARPLTTSPDRRCLSWGTNAWPPMAAVTTAMAMSQPPIPRTPPGATDKSPGSAALSARPDALAPGGGL